jgi:hypothetical protein
VYFNSKTGVISLLTNAAGAKNKKKDPKIFIHIPPESLNFEIGSDGPKVVEASKYLNNVPEQTIDKIMQKLFPTKHIHGFKTPMSKYIIFDEGLDLSSPFGPLPSYVLGVPKNLYEELQPQMKDNETVKRSKFVQELLKDN